MAHPGPADAGGERRAPRCSCSCPARAVGQRRPQLDRGGSLTLQPAEVAKLAIILFVAELLARRSANMADSRLTLVPVLVVAAAIALLVMLQPDLGTTMVLGAWCWPCCTCGVPLLKLGATAALGGAALFLALRKEYRRTGCWPSSTRAPTRSGSATRSPSRSPAWRRGRLIGVGLGASRAKWGFLPNAHTDFIFAIIGEETGLVGALVVVGLFVAFAVLGVRAALHAPTGSAPWWPPDHRLGGVAGPRQHRRGGGPPAHHRPDPALRVLGGRPWWSPWPPPGSC